MVVAPPRTLASAACSAARTAASRAADFRQPRLRHDDHAVRVAQDEVAGGDRHAAGGDRQAHRPGAAAHAAVGGDAAAEHRQAHGHDAVAVADHAVGDDGGASPVAGHAGDEIARHAGAGEALARRHDHVAGLGQGHGREQRQIVVGAAPAGQRHADEAPHGRHLGGQRLDRGVHGATARHGIDQPAGRRLQEWLQELGCRRRRPAADGQPRRLVDHGRGSFSAAASRAA